MIRKGTKLQTEPRAARSHKRKLDGTGRVRPLGTKSSTQNHDAYAPGRITKPCVRCKERPSYPASGGRCWPCDQVRACRCFHPVPLTSSPESLCKCGFQIVRRRA